MEGVTISQMTDILGASSVETIRLAVKRLGFKSIGTRKIGKVISKLYDIRCVDLVRQHCDFQLSGKRETEIRNIEIKNFLSTPLTEGVIWSYRK